MQFGYLFAAGVAVFTASAAVIDFRTRKIPNYLTVSAAVLGLVYHATTGGLGAAGMSLAGFALGFCLLLLPWILGGGGMGDVKLLAALGAWLGPGWILVAFALSAFLGLFMALSVMSYGACQHGFGWARRQYVSAGAGASPRGSGRAAPTAKRVLPFAVPVALGTWLLLAWLLSRPIA